MNEVLESWIPQFPQRSQRVLAVALRQGLVLLELLDHPLDSVEIQFAVIANCAFGYLAPEVGRLDRGFARIAVIGIGLGLYRRIRLAPNVSAKPGSTLSRLIDARRDIRPKF